MNDYKIRKATTDDLPTIMTLIDASREIMRSNGNLTQWPVGYPAAATVKADIDDGTCYSFIQFIYCFKNGSSVANSSAFSTTPLVRHKTSPLRKSISVGTDWMRYWLAVAPYLSTSTLMMRIRLPSTFFTCSRIGCIILQGWHHVAKKSTKTSWPPFITSLNVSIIICLFL